MNNNNNNNFHTKLFGHLSKFIRTYWNEFYWHFFIIFYVCLMWRITDSFETFFLCCVWLENFFVLLMFFRHNSRYENIFFVEIWIFMFKLFYCCSTTYKNKFKYILFHFFYGFSLSSWLDAIMWCDGKFLFCCCCHLQSVAISSQSNFDE